MIEFPVRVPIAGFDVPAHALLEAAGYALAFQVYRALRRRAGDALAATDRWAVIAAAAVGAALGSKLLFLLTDPVATWARRGDPAALFAGKTIVGGILGGWIAVEAVKRMLGIASRTGDLFAAPLCIGIAVGRIGCFLEGLGDATYGVATSLPVGVDFGDGVSRHPTQLYEAVFLALLAAPVLRATLRPHAPGSVFRAFVAAYCAWRFAIDFLKPAGETPGPSGIQWACAAALVVIGIERRRAAGPAHGQDPPARDSAAAVG